MEKLADLPPAALITFGVTLAVIFAARHLGLWQGQRIAPASSDQAQVAAVIVDPSALNRASAAGDALAGSMRDWAKKSDDHVHMICRRLEAQTDAIEAQTLALNALTLEMVRRSGR
ncbi:hypothetical protein [Shinella sp.]|uniref:hypothetical protein n=1 Tax=Shinella sp. TaxID=1870904 RepID=UPI0029BCC474|nr:hypothetical protein [Shinella sp.]MDX3973319.1 hypothetical protein [Shinella sp.]